MPSPAAGASGPPPYMADLFSGQLVMVEGEPLPGYITGFCDDGSIGVHFDGRHISTERKQIVWRQVWRGYGEPPWRTLWPAKNEEHSS